MNDRKIIERVKDAGIDKARLEKALNSNDNWGSMVHSFEYLTVCRAVLNAMKEPPKEHGDIPTKVIEFHVHEFYHNLLSELIEVVDKLGWELCEFYVEQADYPFNLTALHLQLSVNKSLLRARVPFQEHFRDDDETRRRWVRECVRVIAQAATDNLEWEDQ